jgi:RNA polymerase sigma-70 factor (ECF subfamily)
MVLSDYMILQSIRAGSEDALKKVILKYNAYLCVVIRNTVGGKLSYEDVEEVASDTFFALWQNPDRPTARKLKSYLAAIAKNKAINKLRAYKGFLVPLDDTMQIDSDNSLEDALLDQISKNNVKKAVLTMNATDKEIFLRHYYDAQTVPVIAKGIGLSESAVKKRLLRGKEKLKIILSQEEIS